MKSLGFCFFSFYKNGVYYSHVLSVTLDLYRIRPPLTINKLGMHFYFKGGSRGILTSK
jgi:hypothetical protein